MQAQYGRHSRRRHHERPRWSYGVRLDGPLDLSSLLLDANLVPLALEYQRLVLLSLNLLLLLLRQSNWDPSFRRPKSGRRSRGDSSDLKYRPVHLRLCLLLHNPPNRRHLIRLVEPNPSIVLKARQRARRRDPRREVRARGLVGHG